MHAIWRLLKETVSRWLDDFAPSMGAALSFYTLFSLAPLLVIVIAVAGFVFGREAVQGELFAQLQGLIGTESAATIQGLIKSASDPKSGTLAVVIGLVVMLVGATTVFAELQSDLDRIWKISAPPKAGLWALVRERLMTFGMVLAVAFLLLISLVLSAVLAALEKWWSGWLGHIAWLLQAANFAFSFAMAMLLFAMIYKILPRVRIAWSDVWIGSAVTALLFTIGKSAIGFYLGRSGIADAYGAAGSIAVILLWVYYAAQTFLLGAEFTCAYAQIHGSHRPSVQGGQLAA